MPRNGSGLYAPPPANYPAVSATLITAADRNAIDADLATALTNSLAVNGESVVTADIPFGNNKLTGVKDGTSAKDAANVSQIQNSNAILLATVAGTDTITASLSPALTAYANGQIFTLIPANTNTGAVTININGLGAKALTKNGSTALVAGDLVAGVEYSLQYDGTRFQKVAGSDYAKSGANSDITSLSAVTSINGGALAGFKNHIINGDFEIWQRGVSFPSVNGYTADRWFAAQTGTKCTVVKTTLGAAGFRTGLMLSGAAGNTMCRIVQPIEAVNCAHITAARSNNVTISFNAYQETGAAFNVTAMLYKNIALDTMAGAVVVASQVVSVPHATHGRYSATFSVSVSELQYGCIVVLSAESGLTSGLLAFTGVSLEEGATAATFERRPHGIELSLCQRYYESGGFSTVSHSSSPYAGQFVNYLVMKRAVPTVVTYDNAGNVGKLTIDATNNNNSIVLPFINGARIGLNNVAVSPSQFITGSYTAEAEI